MTANTGSGGDAIKIKTEKNPPVTEESLVSSPKSAGKSTKKIKRLTTKEEAVQILSSALLICKEAGFSIRGYNDPKAGLRLSFQEMLLDTEGKKIILKVTLIEQGEEDNGT